jgi:hypothetical protein
MLLWPKFMIECPVILEEKHFELWLSGDGGVELLKPAASDISSVGLARNA